MKRIVIIILSSFGLLITSAFSGEVSANRKSEISVSEPVSTLANQVGGPNKKGVELITGSESSAVSITYKDAWRPKFDSKGSHAYKVTVTAPVDKDSDLNTFANLEGIINGAAIKFNYERWGDNRKHLSDADDVRRDELCEIAKENYKVKNLGVNDENMNCDDEDWLRQYLSANEYAEREWQTWKLTRRAIGFTIQVGREKNKYLNSTFLEEKESEHPWSVGIYSVLAFKKPIVNKWFNPDHLFRPGVLVAGLTYGEKYKPQNKSIVCLDPLATPLTCVNERIGAPTRIEQELVYVEYRSFIKENAYSLRLTHDFESHDVGVDLPIYFLHDKDSNWTGGLRLGWTKEDHGQAAVFVGKAFQLY